MGLVGRRDGRNFGYGRQLSYAGPQALRDLFGGGHYGTVKTHSDRWQTFVQWCRSEDGPGFNDARQIDQKTLLDYARYLHHQIQYGYITISTAQNRLSSVNRTMAALRGDQNVRIKSPSKVLGLKRSTTRVVAPQGQSREQLERIIRALDEQEKHRISAIVHLAREIGMRLREAILADLPRLQREAEKFGRINIQDGTKGGRSGAFAPRWIVVTERVQAALEIAQTAAPYGSRNLLNRNETYRHFINNVIRPSRKVLHKYGLKGFHELRAAYACERYEQITNHSAPVNDSHHSQQNHELDWKARVRISIELGHGRIDVISSYIGGSS